MKKEIETLGFHRDGKILIIDDSFKISEEVKNMSGLILVDYSIMTNYKAYCIIMFET